jgi:site-specific recombinase XerD
MAAADSNAARLAELLRERGKLTDALTAPLTQRGYRYDWAAFERWCASLGLAPLPATTEVVSLYVTERLIDGCKTSTVARNLGAIVDRHRKAGMPSPVNDEVRVLLRGARRLRDERLTQSRPLSTGEMRAISQRLLLEGTPMAMRDRAIILVGFASALRSANLVSLQLADLEFCEQGVRLWIGREKTDQEAKGRLIGLPHGKHPETCPVAALRTWIARRGEFPGPVFTRLVGASPLRSLQPEQVARIVKKAVAGSGFEVAAVGSHSLRSGFVSEAGQNGASELQIALQTGHRDMATLRRYLRPKDIFRVNACAWLGL